MNPSSPISTLFLDIGGILLTNGWDHNERTRAAEKFGMDFEEMNERHHLTFDTYEEGKLSYSCSQPFPEMLELMRGLKIRHGLQVAAVSNEGRELTVYRVQQFKLGSFIDFFILFCFVHYRKPDTDLYHIALDIAQVKPEQVVYIDDRAMFVEVAQGLGINGILHTGQGATQKALEGLGLSLTVEGQGSDQTKEMLK